MGKLGAAASWAWKFLDGWKSWLVAVVATWKLVCQNCAGSGYAETALKAAGWDDVAGAFDPASAAQAFAVMVALGHRLLKAVQQYRAGRPIEELNR